MYYSPLDLTHIIFFDTELFFHFFFVSVLCMFTVTGIMSSAFVYSPRTSTDIGFHSALLAIMLSAISVLLMVGYKERIEVHE